MSKRLREAEVQKKKKQLKLLFRKVVRQLIISTHWLEDDTDQDKKKIQFSAHAGRNIALLVRTKRKGGMLTTSDKSLLRTPPQMRSIPERKRLCVLFSELKCFHSIPPILRARLVPYIKLMSISAGRTLIREKDVPHTIFFIVTGEIEMSRAKLHNLFNTMESEPKIMFGPGDCIGELEMTEGCLRMDTFTARSQCELLALFGDDFDATIKDYMKKVWAEKKKAIKALDYFNFLTEEQILSACKMGSLKQFKPLDRIYSRDKGTVTNVHFVLSGECVILQCLNMKVEHKNGKRVYKLTESAAESTLSEDSEAEVKETDRQSILSLISSEEELKGKSTKKFRKLNLKEIELLCEAAKQSEIKNNQRLSKRQKSSLKYSSSTNYANDEEMSYFRYFEDEYEETLSNSLDSINSINSIKSKISSKSSISSGTSTSSTISKNALYITPSKFLIHDPNLDDVVESDNSEEESNDSEKYSKQLICRFATQVENDETESHFIDVGSLTFGGIFGLGETIQDRVIMARNTVQCLLLPRFFLMDKEFNPGNIWQRRLFYMNCMIPTREMLFNDFLRNLEWKKFKTDYIDSVVKPIAGDVTTIDDIPILCRIEEGIEFD